MEYVCALLCVAQCGVRVCSLVRCSVWSTCVLTCEVLSMEYVCAHLCGAQYRSTCVLTCVVLSIGVCVCSLVWCSV